VQPVLAHRVLAKSTRQAERGEAASTILGEILNRTAVPS
jgi:hypothetical protein